MPRALRNLVRAVGLISMLGSSLASAQSHSLPLLDALVRFQNAWGVDLAYDAALLDNKTTEWDGPVQSSPQADLGALLHGTGFMFYRLSSGTYSVKPEEAAYAALAGVVLDAEDGSPLIRASVEVVETKQGISTDAQGRFLLDRLEPGEYTIRAGHLGYGIDQQTVMVTLEDPVTLTFLLEPQPIVLPVAEVYVNRRLDVGLLRHLDMITGEQVTGTRGVGTPDAIRNINEIVGVRVDEVSSSIHIQGSERGEHQFLLDGNPIFEPVHQHGLVGAFNPFAIARLTVDKAGFPASKGSYLAGVINAEHALEDDNSLPLDLQLDPISINTRLNINAVAENGTRLTLLTAVRKSIWEGGWSSLRSGSINRLLREWNDPDVFLLRASLYPVKSLRPDYYNEVVARLNQVPPADVPLMDFHDFHFAGRVQFNHHTLATSFYHSADKLHGRRLIATIVADRQNISNPDRYDWVNGSGHLAWSFPPAENVLVTTKVRRSRYHLNHSYAGLDRQNATMVPAGLFVGERLVTNLTPTDDDNEISETSIESTVKIEHGIGFLTSGLLLSSSKHRFAIPSTFPQIIDHRRSSSRLAFYVEEQVESRGGLSLTVGSRLTYLSLQKKVYAEPRVDIRWQSSASNNNQFLVRGAAGVYSQFINQFDISTLSPSTLIPSTRFWMPVDETLTPPKAYHFSLDLGLRLGPHWSFRAESYYKIQPRLFRIDYPTLWHLDAAATDEEEPTRITTQDGFIALAKGSAYGSAFVLARNSETLHAGVRYEYNIALREYGFRDGVRSEPVPWSEPHRLELTFDWELHPYLGMMMRWRGGWGRIWGFRQAYYDLLGTDAAQGITFDGFDFRFPTNPEHQLEPFRQLDMGITYGRPAGPTTWRFQLDMLNVLNRSNEADRHLFESVIEDQVAPQTRYLIDRTLSFSLRVQCCTPR